jgi:hypothetical protein
VAYLYTAVRETFTYRVKLRQPRRVSIMPTFDIEPEEITVFPVEEEYWFSHYFDREDLFERLREYYNEDAYRFEIPAEEFGTVREELAGEYIDLVIAEDLESYYVVIEQYTEYRDILRDSVAHRKRQGHRFFLMKDELSVREAVEHGATPLSETDFVVGL